MRLLAAPTAPGRQPRSPGPRARLPPCWHNVRGITRDREKALAPEKWTIEPAGESDFEALFALQRIAFQSEAELYNDPHIHPLVETRADALAEFKRQVVFKAVIDGRIVGSVRGRLHGDTCHVGRLMVLPELRGLGLGRALMERLEQHFSNTRRFELFTGEASERNLRLYGKLGYREYDRRPVTDAVMMVLMEKVRPEGAPPQRGAPEVPD